MRSLRRDGGLARAALVAAAGLALCPSGALRAAPNAAPAPDRLAPPRGMSSARWLGGLPAPFGAGSFGVPRGLRAVRWLPGDRFLLIYDRDRFGVVGEELQVRAGPHARRIRLRGEAWRLLLQSGPKLISPDGGWVLAYIVVGPRANTYLAISTRDGRTLSWRRLRGEEFPGLVWLPDSRRWAALEQDRATAYLVVRTISHPGHAEVDCIGPGNYTLIGADRRGRVVLVKDWSSSPSVWTYSPAAGSVPARAAVQIPPWRRVCPFFHAFDAERGRFLLGVDPTWMVLSLDAVEFRVAVGDLSNHWRTICRGSGACQLWDFSPDGARAAFMWHGSLWAMPILAVLHAALAQRRQPAGRWR